MEGTVLTEQDIDWGSHEPEDQGGIAEPPAGSVADVLIKNELGGKVISTEYPERPDNPHEHRVVVTIKGEGAPWIVIHADTAAEVNALFGDLDTYGTYETIAAHTARLRALAPGARPPVQTAPPTAPMAPQAPVAGPPFGPNVSVPQAPGYVGPPVAPQPAQWQPPQQAGWGGGGQAQAPAQPQPNPGGWNKANARTGPGFDAWKAMREANKDYVKGHIKWAGNSEYWVSPTIAQWIAQQGWAVQ